jgi:thioredoxin-like negative regulator of GroEL
LAAAFAIRSIPSMLFVPMGEMPQMAQGALPKHNLKEIIKDVLKVEV